MASTVTFTRSDDGTTRVNLDGRLFRLGQPVTNVSKEAADRLKAMPGLHFRVESPKPKTSPEKE